MKYLFLLLFLLSTLVFAEKTDKKEYILKFKSFNLQKFDSYRSKYSAKKYFHLSDEKLLKLKTNGEDRIKDELADLRNYFIANLTQEEFNLLKKDKFVSMIYENPKNLILPVAVDIAPVTPLFTDRQGYLYDISVGGVNADFGWQFTGGDGSNVTIVDIEYAWLLDHEDLGFETTAILYDGNTNLTGTMDYGDGNHGVGVLGITSAANNDYGVTGISYGSNVKIVNNFTDAFPKGTGPAILRAISVVDIGTVILLEAQTGGPNRTDESEGQDGLVPVEWAQADFDAIKTATANGFIIIEAAGNGEEDLDTLAYHTCSGDTNTFFTDNSGTESCFNFTTRDSGAIIVGAGAPPSGRYGTPRSKIGFSTAGSRVDVQGWGYDIASTSGESDLFDTTDRRQMYTLTFGGTSGASPIVTGVVAQLQGRYKVKNNGAVLTAFQIRDILKDPNNSHPQMGGVHIGPQPDTKLIFENYLNDDPLCISCKVWEDCNSEHQCILKTGRCNNDTDCTGDTVGCNVETHSCVNVCDGVICSDFYSNSHCVNNHGTAACACDTNYHWNDDTTNCIANNVDLCEGVSCQTNASCNSANGNCECNNGYHPDGNSCIEDVVDVCEGIICTNFYPHTHCIDNNGVGACTCDSNYHWNEDVTICLENEVDLCDGVSCIPGSSCDSEDGRCYCYENYHLADDNRSCIPHNICETLNCTSNSTCNYGLGVCECNNGYHLEGDNCILNSVDLCEGVSCQNNASCNSNNGNCECNNEYHLEVDNCILNSVNLCEGVSCQNNASCNIFNGNCECENGYYLDGNDCKEKSGETSVNCSYNNRENKQLFYMFFLFILLLFRKRFTNNNKI